MTFYLVGGSAAISFSPNGASLLWAAPNSGFVASVDPDDDDVRVEFVSANHWSRIDARWHDGPHHEISERPRSSGDTAGSNGSGSGNSGSGNSGSGNSGSGSSGSDDDHDNDDDDDDDD